MYELIGKSPAQEFFQINATNPIITVQQDLKRDSLRSALYTVCSSYDPTICITVIIGQNTILSSHFYLNIGLVKWP